MQEGVVAVPAAAVGKVAEVALGTKLLLITNQFD